VVDSPLEGSLKSGYGGNETPRLQYRNCNCWRSFGVCD
jgi:hypothetical protein